MHVAFERTGGFSGARISIVLPEGSLPKDEADTLQHLIDEAGFFDLSTAAAGGSAGPDRFHYRLTIRQGAKERTLELDEPDVPPRLQPLLNTLLRLSRQRGRATR